MSTTPFRITDGIPDHDMSDYCNHIKKWCKDT